MKRLVVIAAFLSGMALAEDDASKGIWDALGLSGSLRLSAWERDKSYSSQRGFFQGGAWLQARPKEFLGLRSYFDGKIDFENLTRSAKVNGDLREAYVESSLGRLDLRVGRQITLWGRADKANPTDSFSTRDFTLLATDDEDQRFGSLATLLTWNIDDEFRLIGIWQPEWRFPKYPLPPVSGVSFSYGNPSSRMEQWGAKLDHSGGAIDWSVSFSQTLDRNADMRLVSATAAGTEVELLFQKIDVYGFDFAKVVGDYGLRGELAYVRTLDKTGDDFLTKNPFWFGVLGVDRTFFGDLNVNAQYIFRYTENWHSAQEVSNLSLRSLAEQVEILSNQKVRMLHAGSLRVSYKLFHETLEAEWAMVGWFNNGVSRPKVTYAISDQWKAIAGAEIYYGHPQSFFGRMNSLSTLFAEVRWLF